MKQSIDPRQIFTNNFSIKRLTVNKGEKCRWRWRKFGIHTRLEILFARGQRIRENVAKRWKKRRGRQEEMEQFQPAVDHGDLDGEKGPTGKWRERNDRKTDTL